MSLTPPPIAPQRNNRATFKDLVDAFLTWLINFVTELAALVANLNSLAAGGVYSLQYVFDAATADGDPSPGLLRLGSAVQNAATVIRLDTTVGGKDVTSILDTFDASTSVVKGGIRLQKVGDPSAWLTFDLTARAAPTGYRNITVTCTGSSSANPFVSGDGVMLFFQRNGDQGATGAPTYMKVSDRKSSGAHGGSSVSSDITQTRALNTVETNTITGASLASNTVTLPGGTYKFRGRAPAAQQSVHKAFLYNVTDGTYVGIGSNESCAGTGGQASNSVFSGQIAFAGSKNFTIRHYTSTVLASIGLGQACTTGQSEVYAELEFEKVA